MTFRFTIRDVLWLMVVVALIIGEVGIVRRMAIIESEVVRLHEELKVANERNERAIQAMIAPPVFRKGIADGTFPLLPPPGAIPSGGGSFAPLPSAPTK